MIGLSVFLTSSTARGAWNQKFQTARGIADLLEHRLQESTLPSWSSPPWRMARTSGNSFPPPSKQLIHLPPVPEGAHRGLAACFRSRCRHLLAEQTVEQNHSLDPSGLIEVLTDVLTFARPAHSTARVASGGASDRASRGGTTVQPVIHFAAVPAARLGACFSDMGRQSLGWGLSDRLAGCRSMEVTSFRPGSASPRPSRCVPIGQEPAPDHRIDQGHVWWPLDEGSASPCGPIPLLQFFPR